jgi:hypothetical protein
MFLLAVFRSDDRSTKSMDTSELMFASRSYVSWSWSSVAGRLQKMKGSLEFRIQIRND